MKNKVVQFDNGTNLGETLGLIIVEALNYSFLLLINLLQGFVLMLEALKQCFLFVDERLELCSFSSPHFLFAFHSAEKRIEVRWSAHNVDFIL